MWEQINEIFETLRRNRLRTTLTGFAVGWGVFMLILLLGFGTGLQGGMQSNFENMGLTQTAYECDLWRTKKPFAGFEAGRLLWLTLDDATALEQSFPEIVRAYPAVSDWCETIDTEEKQVAGMWGFVEILAIPHGYLTDVNQLRLKEGRLLTPGDTRQKKASMLIGEHTAKKLFGDDKPKLGCPLTLGKIRGTLVGIYRSDNITNETVYMPLSAMITLNPEKAVQLGNISMSLSHVLTEEQEKDFKSRITRFLAHRKQFDPTDTQALWLESADGDIKQKTGKVMLGMNIFLWIVGLSILAVGIVGVSNIMLVTVRERYREIGIRKAIGARPRQIVFMVLLESILVTLIAGLIGLVVGSGLLLVIDYVMTTAGIGNKDVGMGVQMTFFKNPLISPWVGLGTILVMMVAGLLAGYIPAKRAVAIPAVEAMRE